MTPNRHTSLSLRSLLQGISGALPAYDPRQPVATLKLSQQLERLATQLERDQFDDLVPMSQVAARVAEHLNSKGTLEANDAIELIDTIVAHICKSLEIDVPRTGRELEQARPEPAISTDHLQMVSAKRLGEIMVQLSMLSQEQVEKALAHQKATGCRFGEACVDLHILPREAVQSALRIQQIRRPDRQNPWSGGH